MTAAATLVPGAPLRRSGWWLLFAIHVPMIAFVVAQGWLGLAFPAPARRDAIGLVLAVMACAIQLRHSVAAAQGIRPRYWTWTLLILMLVSIVPLPWFRDQIVTMQWFVVASFAMLLPARMALITSLVSGILIGVWYASITQGANAPMGEMVWAFCYWEALLFLGGAGLYGATRLVRLMDQLQDARAELAELAIGRERLRISRDLHDLLGNRCRRCRSRAISRSACSRGTRYRERSARSRVS